ncbi:hypothetical protein [Microbacterium sp. 10M-3C3]|uniref:hypothetical protein n=1 Tax=Microbacterium sp. 10M-3C3 TaxID=2483401 RepID=UPI000F62E819|nr:hypothetical protein [Microbacterium sp. 10M-3C3]
MSQLTSRETRLMTEVILAGAKQIRPSRGRRSKTILGGVSLVLAGAFAGGAVSTAVANTLSPGVVAPTPIKYELSEIRAFDRPLTSEDTLPPGLPSYAAEVLRPDTSRFVGEYDSVRYFVVQSTGAEPFCLLAYPTSSQDSWVISCSQGLPITGSKPGLFEATLAPTGDTPQGWIALDENVSVNPQP